MELYELNQITRERTDDVPVGMFNIKGVYFLFHQDKLVYIGSSKNIGRRITDHTDKTFDSIFVDLCENFKEKESAYIKKLQPPLNGGKRNKKRQNGNMC